MNEMEFQSKLGDLIKQIGSLPESQRGELEALAEQTRERHVKMKQTIADLQESLDYLRLSIKYLVFDLEATRRENEYLRKLLDTSSKPDSDSNGRED
ncbi:MAG: transcriptional regulator [Phycisphaerales bacterium]